MSKPGGRGQIDQTLPESASLLLDLIRFAAALLVVLCHVTQPEFHLGYRSNNAIGVVAVSIFFVLSGFVIRFVTRTRESSAREYFIDRASRIYSVVLPALALTLVIGGICRVLNEGLFLKEWATLFTHPVQRLVLNLLFLSQAWGHNTIPFINLPFWSLGYECVFYLLYGILFFLRGWSRALLCVLTALIVGPQVIFLFPIWWLGCLLYDGFQALGRSRATTILLATGGAWLGSGLILFMAGHRLLLLLPYIWLNRFSTFRNPITLLHGAPARATLFAFGTGVLAALTLFLLLLLSDRLALPRKNPWSRPIRRVADGTFAIYLMHYPIMVLLVFAGVLRPRHVAGNFAVLILMCALLVAAAAPIDAFKRALRGWLRSVLPQAVKA